MQDREIVSFDGRVLVMKYVDPEVDGRYGTGVFVRCAPARLTGTGCRRPSAWAKESPP